MANSDDRFSFWGTRVIYAGWTAILGLVIGSVPLWVLPESRAVVGGWTMAGAFVAGGIRGARVAAINTQDYLTVRNPYWTHRVAWRDIDEIIDAQPWQLKGLICPAVHRRGRRDIPILAMAAWDRLISSETSRSGVRAAFVIRQWSRSHRVEASALSFVRREHSPKELES